MRTIAHLWQEHFPPPFPALHQLDIDLCLLPKSKRIWSFIAPKLQIVSIADYGRGLADFLEKLPGHGPMSLTLAPTIRSLAIKSRVSVMEHVALLQYLPALETMDLERALQDFRDDPRLYQHLVRELSELPDLRTLILPREYLRLADIPQINHSGYSSLTTLGAFCGPSALASVFNMLPDGMLCRLRLVDDNSHVPRMRMHSEHIDYDSLADQISRKFHLSLKAISLDGRNTTLLPRMLELKHIEDVTIPTRSFAQPFVEAMASSWPLLTALKLVGPPSRLQHQLLRLEGLSMLAPTFPHLQTLSFPFTDDFLPDIISYPPTNHGLKSLYLKFRTTLDYNELAFILDKIFPKLQKAKIKGPMKRGTGPERSAINLMPLIRFNRYKAVEQ